MVLVVLALIAVIAGLAVFIFMQQAAGTQQAAETQQAAAMQQAAAAAQKATASRQAADAARQAANKAAQQATAAQQAAAAAAAQQAAQQAAAAAAAQQAAAAAREAAQEAARKAAQEAARKAAQEAARKENVFGDTCQGLANKYGVVSGVTFGWAPKWAQEYWQRTGEYKNRIAKDAGDRPCSHSIDGNSTNSAVFGNSCQGASNRYLARPGDGVAMPSFAGEWWVKNNCSTKPQPLDVGKNDPSLFGTSCDGLKGRYGVIAGRTFGRAPTWAQQWWQRTGQYAGRTATDKGASPC
jgi:hypothetical protein